MYEFKCRVVPLKTLLGMRFKNYFCAVEVVEFIRLLGQLRVTPSYVKQKTPPKLLGRVCGKGFSRFPDSAM